MVDAHEKDIDGGATVQNFAFVSGFYFPAWGNGAEQEAVDAAADGQQENDEDGKQAQGAALLFLLPSGYHDNSFSRSFLERVCTSSE